MAQNWRGTNCSVDHGQPQRPCTPVTPASQPVSCGSQDLQGQTASDPSFPLAKITAPGPVPGLSRGAAGFPDTCQDTRSPCANTWSLHMGTGRAGGLPARGCGGESKREGDGPGVPGSGGRGFALVPLRPSPGPGPGPRPRPPAPPTPRPDPAPPPEAAAPPLGQQGPAPPGLLGEVTSQRDGGGSFRQLKGDLGPEDPSPSAAGRGRAGSAGAGAGAAVLGLSHPPRIEALGAAGRPESDGESGAVRGAEPAARPAVAAAAAPPPRAQTQEAAGRAGASRTRRRRRHGAQSWEPVPAGPEDRQRLLRRHLSR